MKSTTLNDLNLRRLNSAQPEAYELLSLVMLSAQVFIFGSDHFRLNLENTGLVCTRLHLVDFEKLRGLTEKDVLILEEPHFKILQKLSRLSCCRIFVFSRHPKVIDFCDHWIDQGQFEIFCMLLTDELKLLKNEFYYFRSTFYRRALFLDRDGVIINHVDHIKKHEDVRLKDGVVSLIQKANQLGIAVVVVTNQSGLGCQYFTWREFD